MRALCRAHCENHILNDCINSATCDAIVRAFEIDQPRFLCSRATVSKNPCYLFSYRAIVNLICCIQTRDDVTEIIIRTYLLYSIFFLIVLFDTTTRLQTFMHFYIFKCYINLRRLQNVIKSALVSTSRISLIITASYCGFLRSRISRKCINIRCPVMIELRMYFYKYRYRSKVFFVSFAIRLVLYIFGYYILCYIIYQIYNDNVR